MPVRRKQRKKDPRREKRALTEGRGLSVGYTAAAAIFPTHLAGQLDVLVVLGEIGLAHCGREETKGGIRERAQTDKLQLVWARIGALLHPLAAWQLLLLLTLLKLTGGEGAAADGANSAAGGGTGTKGHQAEALHVCVGVGVVRRRGQRTRWGCGRHTGGPVPLSIRPVCLPRPNGAQKLAIGRQGRPGFDLASGRSWLVWSARGRTTRQKPHMRGMVGMAGG